uniref:Uncharacterized protein n=1 Tax=Salvator merianae TaxID=96440 RepID=A0A8D0E083_SALMN
MPKTGHPKPARWPCPLGPYAPHISNLSLWERAGQTNTRIYTKPLSSRAGLLLWAWGTSTAPSLQPHLLMYSLGAITKKALPHQCPTMDARTSVV